MIRPILSSKYSKSIRTLKLNEMPVSKKPKIAAIDLDDIKDFVSENADEIPVVGMGYRGYKVLDSLADGNIKGAVNNGVAMLDSGVKTSVATSAAGAATVFGGPVAGGAAYTATVAAWNKSRKTIIDVGVKKGPDFLLESITGVPELSKTLPQEVKKAIVDDCVEEVKKKAAISILKITLGL